MTQPGRSLNPPFRRWAGRLLGVVLPPVCMSCGAFLAQPHALCGSCWANVDFISDPVCQCCGRPLEFEIEMGGRCGPCLSHPPIYDRARAAVVYSEHSRRFILAYKHGDRLDMVPSLVNWLSRAGSDLVRDADIIAPVPLHWTRFLMRRYNQSAELARGLGRLSGVPYQPSLLTRNKRTLSQAGLTGTARAKNVRGAFSVSRSRWSGLAGKRVLLVDDVLTTGATVNACAGVLLWAGAVAVDVLTVARVVREEFN